jgi:biopolymer transport protein ExbB
MGILSVALVGLIFFNLFWLRKSLIASTAFLSTADRLIQDKNIEALMELCKNTRQVTAQVVGRVIEFAKDNPQLDMDSLNRVAEAEGAKQAAKVNQPTQLIMDIGVMAPMVGLLGTVVGILRSFGTIASDATPMRTMLLAGGVSQALIATALGLAIGLIAMFFYAIYRVRVQNLVTYLDTTLTELLVRVYARLASGK